MHPGSHGISKVLSTFIAERDFKKAYGTLMKWCKAGGRPDWVILRQAMVLIHPDAHAHPERQEEGKRKYLNREESSRISLLLVDAVEGRGVFLGVQHDRNPSGETLVPLLTLIAAHGHFEIAFELLRRNNGDEPIDCPAILNQKGFFSATSFMASEGRWKELLSLREM